MAGNLTVVAGPLLAARPSSGLQKYKTSLIARHNGEGLLRAKVRWSPDCSCRLIVEDILGGGGMVSRQSLGKGLYLVPCHTHR